MFRVRVHRVIASSSFTSLEWAIVSVTGGDGGGGSIVPTVRQRGRRDSDRLQPGRRERTGAPRRWRRDRPAHAGDDHPPRLGRGGWCAVPTCGPGPPCSAARQGGHGRDELPAATQRHSAGRSGLRRARPAERHDPPALDASQRRGPCPDEPHVLAASTQQPAGGEDRRLADALPTRAQLEQYTATVGPSWCAERLRTLDRPAPSRNVASSGPAVREPDSPSCTNTATARSPLPAIIQACVLYGALGPYSAVPV